MPANFVPSILAAPDDLKSRPWATPDAAGRVGALDRGDAGHRPEVLCMLRTLIKENGEAQQAVARRRWR